MATAPSESREILRPCDPCRRGKRRCDGPYQPDRVCSRCRQLSKACSYVDPAEYTGSSAQRYVEALESRLRKVEALLQQHVPAALLIQELAALAMSKTNPTYSTQRRNESNEDLPEVATLLPALERWDGLIVLSREQQGNDSSADVAPSSAAQSALRRPEFWRIPEDEFWMKQPEKRDLNLDLPPPDQLAPLIQAYFETWNAIFPIFHRRLFERQLLDYKSAPDKWRFGVVVLLICALGENRLASGAPLGRSPPGWKYFLQAEPYLHVPTPAKPQLLDIHIFFLGAAYIGYVHGNSMVWSLLGTSIRLAHLANAHRRARYNSKQPNLLDELWKRTFWMLVVSDRVATSRHGRPLLIKDETFDLELPLEVDDDCWDLATAGYPLRKNIPANPTQSLYSFFAAHIRLALILGVSIRTIYSINRSRLLMGFVGSDWEKQITSKIDQMLNDWVVTLPHHLRWDPDVADLNRFTQSAFLSIRYHTLRINAHNPFMRTTVREFARAAPSSKTAANLATSLTICTEAAVECSEVLTAVVERHPHCLGQPCWVDAPFVCGLVLLVNLFGFKTSMSDSDTRRLTSYVRICLEALTINSRDDSDALERRETISQLMAELEREPPTSLFHGPRSQPHRRQRLQISQPEFVQVTQQAPLHSNHVQPPFCLEAIPPDLRSHMSKDLRHPTSRF